MSEAANEEEFQDPLLQPNFSRAHGAQRDSATRIGGIIRPEKSRLPKSQVIFRIGDEEKSLREDVSGVWWMLESTLELNVERAPDVDSFVGMVRQNMAVPPAFNPMTRLLKAVVQQPLSIFAGVGSGIFKWQLPEKDQTGAPNVLLGGIEMGRRTSRDVSLRYQLYIPGLAKFGASSLMVSPPVTVAEWFGRRGKPY